VLAVLGFVVAGRRVERTRYRPDRWRAGELVAVGSGISVAVLTQIVNRMDPQVILPSVADGPELTVLALVAVMIGAVPAVLTPPPLLDPMAGVRT
jgi:energy-coupling factor transport system permease protein